jgi:hypothetical protein
MELPPSIPPFEKLTSLFSLHWRERVKVREIVSGFTLTLVLYRQGRGKEYK